MTTTAVTAPPATHGVSNDTPAAPGGLRLAASYLLAGTATALVVLLLLGWSDVAHPWVIVGDSVVATVAGLLVLAADRSGRRVPLGVQYAVALAGIALISGTSFGIGGPEGAIFACSYGFTLAIVAMHYPLRIVLGVLALIGAAYSVVVVASGGTFTQWVLVLITVAASGLLTGRYHRRTRQLAGRLRALESWRAMLMSSLAHDLRSPLGMADSTMQLLQSKAGQLTDAQCAELLSAARRHQHRAIQLTHDLLDHERVHAGTLSLDLEPTVLAEVVREACSHVPIDVRIEVAEDLVVEADPTRLQQVVINLVHNAMKYGATPIVVGASQEGEVVRCWVRDHGRGVPPELTERIFTRFGAGDAADAVGLGLWIVERLVQAHGGEIEHEDATPGARFTWTLRTSTVLAS